MILRIFVNQVHSMAPWRAGIIINIITIISLRICLRLYLGKYFMRIEILVEKCTQLQTLRIL